MISSDINETLNISDRIIVMFDGKISGILNADEANEEKRVKIAQEIKQLVLPGTMGEVFKVMALSKKQSVKLDGFKELDLTNRL